MRHFSEFKEPLKLQNVKQPHSKNILLDSKVFTRMTRTFSSPDYFSEKKHQNFPEADRQWTEFLSETLFKIQQKKLRTTFSSFLGPETILGNDVYNFGKNKTKKVKRKGKTVVQK